MKKFVVLGLCILSLVIGKNVYAKDTMYSLNKYDEEELEYILKSYKENKADGYVVAGTSVEKKKNETNNKIMLLKYKNNGNRVWEYNDNISEGAKLLGLNYTYDEENQVNGYLLLINTRKEEQSEARYYFLRINLEGKLEEEKELDLGIDVSINKIIEVKNGYLLSGSVGSKAFLAKYDQNQNKIWEKDYRVENSFATVIDNIYLEDVGYYALISLKKEEEQSFQLIKWDKDGNFAKVIKEDFESKDSPRLENGMDSFLLYGITHEIKLSSKDSASYYMIKYNLNDEVEWETIGETPINTKKTLQVQSLIEDNRVKEYYVLVNNSSDKSIEVINVDKDGVIGRKIKKLKNGYYKVNRFLTDGSSIYFIGQVDCPEEDNCDYHNNSLYLVSDEDKVIEVKDNTSRTIVIVFGILVVGIAGMYFLRKKKK